MFPCYLSKEMVLCGSTIFCNTTQMWYYNTDNVAPPIWGDELKVKLGDSEETVLQVVDYGSKHELGNCASVLFKDFFTEHGKTFIEPGCFSISATMFDYLNVRCILFTDKSNILSVVIKDARITVKHYDLKDNEAALIAPGFLRDCSDVTDVFNIDSLVDSLIFIEQIKSPNQIGSVFGTIVDLEGSTVVPLMYTKETVDKLVKDFKDYLETL